MDYDLIIVGGGAAGFSAGIYTARRGLSTRIISKDVGGQASLTSAIENYPGIDFVDGRVLMVTMKRQAEKFGCAFVVDEVIRIQKEGELFRIGAATGTTHTARSVLLTFGMSPKNLDVPGEAKFVGKGVVYSAVGDATLYKGKDVVVVGGGNSALEAAAALAPIAARVTVVHRRNEFRGDEVLEQRVRGMANVSLMFESVVIEVRGEDALRGLSVEHVTTKERRDVPCDAVIVAIGHVAKTRWLGDLVEYDTMQHIIANMFGETKTPGLFAAGDSVSGSYKQIATSSGDGVRAALRAYQYLTKTTGRILPPDWDIKEK